MALNLGDLVAGLRADDSGFVRGLNNAQLRMRGLTRDVNGQLRDLHGRFVTTGAAAGRALGGGLAAGARMAVGALKKVAPAVAAIGVGLPAVAAATAALGGLAAGAAAAGLAVKAFSLAAGPQMDAVKDVATLAEEAQKAAASGAEDAAEKQKAYTDALKQLPPATQDTAKAFIGLKGDYKAWSDEMSGTTMPVFTKGIEILRGLLPTLTPFVQAAASAIGGFLDEVAVGVKSAGFKEWAADMSSAAGPALRDFLTVIRNLAVGFGGMLQAFLPTSAGVTGGLVEMSGAFARWGASLKGSEGFATFLEVAREGGGALGQLALAAGNLLVALGPLIGVTTQVALALARIINALPPEVLSVLATTIAAVVIGMKAWAVGARVVAVANTLMASSTYRAIAGWTRMMAVGVAAYVRIAAAAVASAARTAAAWAGAALRSMATFAAQMIRTAAVAVAQFVLMAARAVVWAATMAAQWLIAMGPVGWIIAAVIGLVALIIANWDTIKRWTIQAWTAIWGFIKSAAGKIWDFFLNWTIIGLVIKHWDTIWSKTKQIWNTVVSWLKGVPRMIYNAFLNFTPIGLIIKHWSTIRSRTVAAWNALLAWVKKIPGWIYQAFLNWTALGLLIKHWDAMKTATVRKATEMITWVKGIPGRVKSALGNLGGLLVSAGRALIQGFIDGIKNMLGSVKSAASGVVEAARDFFPFSPAKRGPFAGKGYTTYSGRALIGDFAKSIEAGIPAVDRTLASLASMPTAGQMAMSAANGAAGAGMSRGSTTNNTYNLTTREITLQQFEALQRRQDALARVGRPR